jgi:hypothetical protein
MTLISCYRYTTDTCNHAARFIVSWWVVESMRALKNGGTPIKLKWDMVLGIQHDRNSSSSLYHIIYIYNIVLVYVLPPNLNTFTHFVCGEGLGPGIYIASGWSLTAYLLSSGFGWVWTPSARAARTVTARPSGNPPDFPGEADSQINRAHSQRGKICRCHSPR